MAKSKLNPELVLMAAEEGAKQLMAAQQKIAGQEAENATLITVIETAHKRLEGTQDLSVFQIRGEIDMVRRYLARFVSDHDNAFSLTVLPDQQLQQCGNCGRCTPPQESYQDNCGGHVCYYVCECGQHWKLIFAVQVTPVMVLAGESADSSEEIK